jgi:hypothetical protein
LFFPSMVYLTTLPVSHNSQCGLGWRSINNKLERIWEKVVMPNKSTSITHDNFPEGTEVKHEKHVNITTVQ